LQAQRVVRVEGGNATVANETVPIERIAEVVLG
jgi:hypothetical protein